MLWQGLLRALDLRLRHSRRLALRKPETKGVHDSFTAAQGLESETLRHSGRFALREPDTRGRSRFFLGLLSA
jgi:hypothetical protein